MNVSPPVTKKEIFGWAMFDFANSSYTTVVITVVYSAFFVGHIVPPGSGMRDSYWSIAILLSTVVALVLSPLAGAICDYSGKKKRYLFYSTAVCALATASLAFVGPGGIWPAIALIVVSNAAFMLSESFCGSFLPDISTPKNMGKISGIGWGIGYLGGLASVIVATRVIIRTDPPESAPFKYIAENQMAMVAIGLFFFVAALPTFLLVKNRSRPAPGFERAGFGKLLAAGFREFAQGAATARKNRILFQFLGAFMVYMAGLDAIVKFVGIYAREEVRLSAGELGMLFLVLQLSAAAGALVFGWLEGKIGPKRTVLLTLAWWIVGVLGIYFLEQLAALGGSDPKRVFYGLALMAGAGIGATQASSRTVVGLLSPPDKTAQMFGFWGMFSRLGTVLGTSFGFVADGFQSRRAAVLVVVAFFVLGAILLSRVDIDKGIRDAHGARA
ncbi:MAG: MFS transporter [Gemmatimonadales bacterium]|nr:MFS transporter [Gemmatimonadales bacterium]